MIAAHPCIVGMLLPHSYGKRQPTRFSPGHFLMFQWIDVIVKSTDTVYFSLCVDVESFGWGSLHCDSRTWASSCPSRPCKPRLLSTSRNMHTCVHTYWECLCTVNTKELGCLSKWWNQIHSENTPYWCRKSLGRDYWCKNLTYTLIKKDCIITQTTWEFT